MAEENQENISQKDESLKAKTKKALLWKFFDQTATHGMQFVVGIVMARLLSPEDFGITALPAVFMAIAGIFMDSGFGQALVRKQDLTEKDLSTSFFYSIGMGIFMYACLFFVAPFIADFYDTPILTSIIRVTALNFLWGPLATPQSVILQRKLDFKTPARISVINKIVAGAVGITVAYLGFGVWALVVSGLVSSLLGLIQTWFAVKWIPREKFSKESFKYLWDYGNKMIGANLIDVAYNNIAPIFIGKYYSTKDLGFYNRANGYAKLPANQITGLVQSVTFPILSKMQDDNDFLRSNYRKMIRLTAFVSFPLFFMISILAEPLVFLLLSSKWHSSILLLQILCFERMLWPIHSLNRNLLCLKGRSDLFLKVELYKKFSLFILTCISLPFGITFFCCMQIFQGVLAFFFNSYYTKSLINLTVFEQLKDLSSSFLVSLVVFFLDFLLIQLFDSQLVRLLVGSLTGVLGYLLFFLIFKLPELEYLKLFFKSHDKN